MGQLLAVSKMEAKGCSNLGCGHPYDTAPSTVKRIGSPATGNGCSDASSHTPIAALKLVARRN